VSDQLIRLLLVDDHPSFLRPLGFMLDREPGLTVVAVATTVAETRERLAEGIGVDVAVVDLDLPDGSGVDLIHDISTANPDVHVVVLSGTVDPQTRALAVAAGASAVFSKAAEIAEVIDAARRLVAGESVIPPAEAVTLLRQAGRLREQERAAAAVLGRLTPRERDVLQALAVGFGDRAIASHLGIAERTVRVHMVNLLAKLGVESRLQAVVFAVRHGVVKFR
jgi:DNA-binding NarL/FixJ family response regulator